MKNLENNNGLSLSQAQSVSNLCNQRCSDISDILDSYNNYSKTIRINNDTHCLKEGHSIKNNTDTVDLIIKKSKYHACQAFLMENIKTKSKLLNDVKLSVPDTSDITPPEEPVYKNIDDKLLPNVDESWGWGKLSRDEYNEYIEAESYAAHIGQFIHKRGRLDFLRREISDIPSIEWMEVETGKKTPVMINKHHTPSGLLELHEKLASIHREHEQRVNYYKAKVKNMVTEENSRIAKHNNDLQNESNSINEELRKEYSLEVKKYMDILSKRKKEFEIERQKKIQEISSMRIVIDPRFQDTVNEFLKKIQ